MLEKNDTNKFRSSRKQLEMLEKKLEVRNFIKTIRNV